MNLLLYPDSHLRDKCKSVDIVTPDIQKTLDLMMETMDELEGVGLSAPQCGIMLRMFVMHIPGHEKLAFINPEISDTGEGISSINECCLSLPGALLEVDRPSAIRLHALNYFGEPVDFHFRGLASICVQHENDHLNGVLIIDGANPIEKRLALQDIWNAEHPHH